MIDSVRASNDLSRSDRDRLFRVKATHLHDENFDLHELAIILRVGLWADLAINSHWQRTC